MQKSNWTKYKLGNFCLIKTKTITPLPNQRYYLYSLPGFDNHKTPEFVYGKDIKSNKFLVEGNGILYNKLNIQFKRIWKVPQTSEWPMICSTEFLPIYPTNDIDFNFFYYILTSGAFSNSMRSCSTGTSNSHQRIKLENILNYELFLPSLHEQKKIADILGAFDDKIELLQKQNTTLENMAKALFKSWFVDFDVVHAKQQGQPKAAVMQQYHLTEELYNLFPSSFEPSALGPIPTGWQVNPLENLACLIMGQSPAGTSYNEKGEGLPFYQGSTDFSFRFPKKRVYCTAPSRIAEKGDILISVRAPVGDLNIAKEKTCIGRGLAALHPTNSIYSFLYYSLLNTKKRLSVFNTEGTVFGSINRKDLSSLLLLNPSKKMLQYFNTLVLPFDIKIESNHKQIQTLTEMRDALLPRLISGKIRV